MKNGELDMALLKEQYGDRLYDITIEIEVDDTTTEKKNYIFRRPSAPSYDRMLKNLSASPAKTSRDFVLDNIIDEQRALLLADLEEYPAIAQTVLEKLTSMLGLAKTAAVKKL